MIESCERLLWAEKNKKDFENCNREKLCVLVISLQVHTLRIEFWVLDCGVFGLLE